jgi:hypothetical protein
MASTNPITQRMIENALKQQPQQAPMPSEPLVGINDQEGKTIGQVAFSTYQLIRIADSLAYIAGLLEHASVLLAPKDETEDDGIERVSEAVFEYADDEPSDKLPESSSYESETVDDPALD